GKYVDDEVVTAYADALDAKSPEEQGAALQEVVQLVSDKAMDIPYWFDPLPNVWSPKVVGIQPYMTKQEFRGVGVRADGWPHPPGGVPEPPAAPATTPPPPPSGTSWSNSFSTASPARSQSCSSSPSSSSC